MGLPTGLGRVILGCALTALSALTALAALPLYPSTLAAQQAEQTERSRQPEQSAASPPSEPAASGARVPRPELPAPLDPAARIRVAVEPDNPPFSTRDANGDVGGFDIALSLELCKRLGMTCAFVLLNREQLIPALLSGRIDVAAASLAITPQRRRLVAFTQKYHALDWRFVTCGLGLRTASPQALAGRRIGVLQASVAEDRLRQAFAESTLVPFARSTPMRAALRSRAIDVMVAPGVALLEWLRGPGRGCRFVGTLALEPEIATAGAGLALRPEDEALRDRLDAALSAMIRDGSYARLMARYFPVSIY